MTQRLSFALAFALCFPALASAQRTAEPAARERTEEPSAAEGAADPAACEISVQLPEAAVNEDGQVSLAEARRLPRGAWTHVMVTHGRRAAQGSAPDSEAIVEALAALDRNGDGVLNERELAGHLRGGNGISVELSLPARACE